jgi:hypothetical protein
MKSITIKLGIHNTANTVVNHLVADDFSLLLSSCDLIGGYLYLANQL